MTERTLRAGLQVATPLAALIEDRILPGTGVDAGDLWRGFARLLADLVPVNRQLLAKRDALQGALDQWHRENPGAVDPEAYLSFLREDRKSTRLNSSHVKISYAVFCLKKKRRNR